MELNLSPVVKELVNQLAAMVVEQVKEQLGKTDVEQAVEDALNNYEFSDVLDSYFDNSNKIEDAVSQAIDDYDISDKVKDAVNELTFEVSVS